MSICTKKLKKKLKRTLTYHWYEQLRKKEREFRFYDLKKNLRQFGMVPKKRYLLIPEYDDMTSDEDNCIDFMDSGRKIDVIKNRKRRGSSPI